MKAYRQIRANFDSNSIVVYQAYRPAIAEPAIDQGKFVDPFSWNRMTWIKPSFLWMMARSNWAQKKGQEYVLAIRIKRSGWESALAQAELTSYKSKHHASRDQWRTDFKQAKVHVQWDPERTLHGKKLENRSIQVGIGRQVIQDYTDDWILEISDFTPVVRKIRRSYLAGDHRKAKERLPQERVYPVPEKIAKRLMIGSNN